MSITPAQLVVVEGYLNTIAQIDAAINLNMEGLTLSYRPTDIRVKTASVFLIKTDPDYSTVLEIMQEHLITERATAVAAINALGLGIILQQTVLSSRYSNANTFYAPAIGRGAVNATAAIYNDADTVYAPAIVTGALVPPLYSNTNTFYAPVAAPGAANVAPAIVLDADTVYAPTVAQV